MAFPGKYDFNYYKGDTLEFKVYPKTTTGLPFSLEGYSAQFNIATARGLPADEQIPSYAQISPDSTYITCAITPTEGNQLIAGTRYVYDIEVRNPVATPYKLVYTLLNGNISIEDQVTNVVEEVTVTIPTVPLNLAIVENPTGTLTATWDAPTSADATSYKVYVKAPAGGLADYIQIPGDFISRTYSVTSSPVLPIVTGVEYFIKVVASNSAGDSATAAEESIVAG
jgi:hypothetical protein